METHWLGVADSQETASKVEKPVLAAERTYEACALAFHDSGQGYFWLIGEAFNERKAAGCVYPDLVPFEKCEIVDGSIPPTWTTRLVHAPGGAIVLMGPSAFIAPGFHEKLTDGDPTAVRVFLEFLRNNQCHSDQLDQT